MRGCRSCPQLLLLLRDSVCRAILLESQSYAHRISLELQKEMCWLKQTPRTVARALDKYRQYVSFPRRWTSWSCISGLRWMSLFLLSFRPRRKPDVLTFDPWNVYCSEFQTVLSHTLRPEPKSKSRAEQRVAWQPLGPAQGTPLPNPMAASLQWLRQVTSKTDISHNSLTDRRYTCQLMHR